MLLVGCSDDSEIKKLREENTQLKEQTKELVKQNRRLISSNQDAQDKVNANYGKAVAEQDHMDSEAAIANGCRAIFNICTNSMTAPGDAVIKNGTASGGSGLIFWFIFTCKFLFIIFIVFLSIDLWTRRFKPNLDAAKNAQIELHDAENKLSQIKKQELARRADISELNNKYGSTLEMMLDHLESIEQSIKNAEEEQAAERHRVQITEEDSRKRKSAMHALQSFRIETL
jgi:preprotein translocase subunit SecF